MSMIRKYHNHKLKTTPWHREEKPLNHHETPGRQIKQSPTKNVFSLFCPYSYQSLATTGVFLYYCPYPNQSPALSFCFSILPYSNQSPTLKEFFFNFSPYSNQSPTKKVFIFSILALILTKSLHNGVLSSILLLS